MLSRMLHLEKVMQEHRLGKATAEDHVAETGNHFFLFCLFYTVIHTSRASMVMCACVCVCVCVCVFIN